MKVTASLFEAYLKCPTKCYLQLHGESRLGNTHAEWFRVQSEFYRSKGIRRLITGLTADEFVSGVLDREKLTAAKWRLAYDVEAGAEDLESTIHAVERLPPTGRGHPSQFVPIRFIFTNKLTRNDKFLLSFDALALATGLGREVNFGKIIRVGDHATFRVKTATLAKQTRKVTENIRTFVSGNSPPDLILCLPPYSLAGIRALSSRSRREGPLLYTSIFLRSRSSSCNTIDASQDMAFMSLAI